MRFRKWLENNSAAMNAETFQQIVRPLLPSGVEVTFEDYGNGIIELADIRAKRKGTGAGTQAMQIIKREAVKHNVTLMLLPAGSGDSDERLDSWYRSLGFDGDETLYFNLR